MTRLQGYRSRLGEGGYVLDDKTILGNLWAALRTWMARKNLTAQATPLILYLLVSLSESLIKVKLAVKKKNDTSMHMLMALIEDR